MYIGVENPIAATISGVPSDKIQFSVSQGTFTKVGGEYLVKPTTAGNATVKVWANVDGKTIGNEMVFRVRMLPTPIAKVGGKSGGGIDKNVLAAQSGILADMGDFLFDLKYVVSEFQMTVLLRDGEKTLRSTSPAFTSEQKALINSLTKGQRVIFDGIKAKGPDGIRDLLGINLQIN
jgi:hypothetical protein